MAFSSIFVSSLGSQYEAFSNMISLLLIGGIVAPIVMGYFGYAYVFGLYKDVLAMGMIENITRIILYILLVLRMGDIVADLSYAIGIIVSFLRVELMMRRTKLSLQYTKTVQIFIILGLVNLFVLLLSCSPFIGIPLVLLPTYFIYAHVSIPQKADAALFLKSLIGEELTTRISQISRMLQM